MKHNMQKEFAKDVAAGLSKKQKSLPSKYFYDEKGDKLFQEIMKMEEYYLTRSEFEIFSQQSDKISQLFKEQFEGKKFRLIEFGAGDGLKTKLLLEQLLKDGQDFQYVPVDISPAVLKELKTSLKERWPELDCSPIATTYTKALKKLEGDIPQCLMFLGSNLGNFEKKAAAKFLKKIHKRLYAGDLFLMGIDLKKSPELILNAYNDKHGITRSFNLNLLERMNRELDADFAIEHFSHFPTYDPLSGVCKSYIVSEKDQTVHIGLLKKEFKLKYAEAIHTELSIKYDIEEVEDLLSENGFKKLEHFFDCKHYFVDTIWKK